MRRAYAITLTAAACALALTAVNAAPARSGAEQSGPVPTFSKDVAPILYKNCVGCHRPGEIGPMSLLTYNDARPHAKAIRDEVGDGNMPPWHADPKHGRFANDRRLSDSDRTQLMGGSLQKIYGWSPEKR